MTHHDMRFHAGPRLGLWTVIPCQLIVMIGLDIVYCVTAGKAMYYVYQHTCDGYETHTCRSFGLSCWIVIFAVIQMFLSMVSSAHQPVLQFITLSQLACYEATGKPEQFIGHLGTQPSIQMQSHVHHICTGAELAFIVLIIDPK